MRVTDSARYTLLPPECVETPLDMMQRISGSWGGRELVFDGWVVADGTQVGMSFLSGFGAGMGELSFTGKEISFTSAVFPASLKPEYIVADFQFCFYRPEALAAALEEGGLEFDIARRGETELRVIREGGRPVIEIEKTRAAVRLTHIVRGYSYTLQGDFP